MCVLVFTLLYPDLFIIIIVVFIIIIFIILYILFIVIVVYFFPSILLIIPLFAPHSYRSTIKTNNETMSTIRELLLPRPPPPQQTHHPGIDFTWCLLNTMQTIVIFYKYIYIPKRRAYIILTLLLCVMFWKKQVATVLFWRNIIHEHVYFGKKIRSFDRNVDFKNDPINFSLLPCGSKTSNDLK